MFVCLDCGCTFEKPIRWKEDRGECFGFPSYEEISGSPCCKSNYTESHRCNCCDEWIDDIYIKTDDGNRYCLDCYQVYQLGDED